MRLLPSAFALLSLLTVAATVAADGARHQYRIEARLDVEAAQVEGRVELVWVNPSPTRSQDALVLRLIPNAFRSPDSAYFRAMAEQRPDAFRQVIEQRRFGGIELLSLSVGESADLAGELDASGTSLRIPLPEPAPPGGRVALSAHFRTTVPPVVARFGHVDGLFVLVQWFPQAAGYRCCGPDEGFVAPEHHLHTEFFKDFADFDVVLDLPADAVLGSSGVEAAPPRHEGDRVVHHRIAEQVHDFAWVADPDFSETRAAFGEVELVALTQPDRRADVDRFLEPARSTVELMGDWFGAYPYPRLTLVQGHRRHGAMEYPNLVLLPGADLVLPRGVRIAEASSIHEVAHQWWFGLSGSDETHHAWMDEGLTSWCTALISEALYGAGRDAVDLAGLRASVLGQTRARYLGSLSLDPPDTPGRDFVSNGAYVIGSYVVPHLALETLARRRSPDAVRAALRRFLQRARYRHPSPDELYAAFAEEIDRDAADFLRRWMQEPGSTDPAVLSVLDAPVDPLAPSASDAARRQLVKVVQRGTRAEPVEVEIRFEDHHLEQRRFDGAGWAAYRFERTSPIASVVIDPQHTLPLDADPTNNRWLAQPTPAVAAQTRSLWALVSLALALVGP